MRGCTAAWQVLDRLKADGNAAVDDTLDRKLIARLVSEARSAPLHCNALQRTAAVYHRAAPAYAWLPYCQHQ